jgi:hypothetical protein
MENNVLLEIKKIRGLMDLLLTEGNIKSEFILYLAKYLDEVITASDGDVDRAIAKFGGNLDQADKIALKKLLSNPSSREEIINIAKKSWGSKSLPTTSDAFNEFVLKIETKLSDDVAKKIVDDSWGLALEKSDDLRDIYDGSINTIIEKTRQHLNEGTSIEEIRKNYKAMLKSSPLFKDKDELVDYLVSRMEKEEKFYKFANENKDKIKGWYGYKPSNILPGLKAELPSGWEKWLYKPLPELSSENIKKLKFLSWAKYLIRDLPGIDNFYTTIKNVTKKWDDEGFSGSKYDQVRFESFQIINQMFSVMNDPKMSAKAKTDIMSVLQKRMATNMQTIKPPTNYNTDNELVMGSASKLYDEIKNALRVAADNEEKYPGAKEFYEWMAESTEKKTSALDQIKHVLELADKIDQEGKSLLFDLFWPQFKKYEDDVEEIKIIVSSEKNTDLSGIVAKIKEGKNIGLSLLERIWDTAPVQAIWTNFRYGVTISTGRMRNILMKYGYFKGIFVIYFRLLFYQTVVIPAYDMFYQIVVGLTYASEGEIPDNFLKIYPSYWRLDEEERQIFKQKFLDEIQSIYDSNDEESTTRFVTEFINKVYSDFSLMYLVPIFGGFVRAVLSGTGLYENPDILRDEQGMFNSYLEQTPLFSIEDLVEDFKAIKQRKGFKMRDNYLKEIESLKQKLLTKGEKFLKDSGLDRAKNTVVGEEKKKIEDEYINSESLDPALKQKLQIIKDYFPIITTDPKIEESLNQQGLSKQDTLTNQEKMALFNDGIKKFREGMTGLWDPLAKNSSGGFGVFYPFFRFNSTMPDEVAKCVTDLRTNYPTKLKDGTEVGTPFQGWPMIQKDGKYYGLDKVDQVVSRETLKKIIEGNQDAEFVSVKDDLQEYLEGIKKINTMIRATNYKKKSYENYVKTLNKVRYSQTIDLINSKISDADKQINDYIKQRTEFQNEINNTLKRMRESKNQKLIDASWDFTNNIVEKNYKGVKLVDGYLQFEDLTLDELKNENYLKYITNKLIKEMNEGKKFGEDNFKHWKDTFKFKKYDEKTNQLKDVKITAKMDEIMDRIDHFRKKYDEDDSFVRAVIDVYGTGIDIIQYTKGLAHLTEGVIVGGLLGVLSTIRESKELVTWTVKHYKDGNWELVKGNFNKKELLNVGKTKRERDERQKESDKPADGLKKKEQESIMILSRDEKEGLNGLPTKVKQKVKEKLRQGWTTEKPFDFLNTYYSESEINSVFNDKIKIYKLKPSAEFFRSLSKNSSKVTVKKGFCKSVKNAKGEYDLSEREKNTLNHFISKCESKFGV